MAKPPKLRVIRSNRFGDKCYIEVDTLYPAESITILDPLNIWTIENPSEECKTFYSKSTRYWNSCNDWNFDDNYQFHSILCDTILYYQTNQYETFLTLFLFYDVYDQ